MNPIITNSKKSPTGQKEMDPEKTWVSHPRGLVLPVKPWRLWRLLENGLALWLGWVGETPIWRLVCFFLNDGRFDYLPPNKKEGESFLEETRWEIIAVEMKGVVFLDL